MSKKELENQIRGVNIDNFFTPRTSEQNTLERPEVNQSSEVMVFSSINEYKSDRIPQELDDIVNILKVKSYKHSQEEKVTDAGLKSTLPRHRPNQSNNLSSNFELSRSIKRSKRKHESMVSH